MIFLGVDVGTTRTKALAYDAETQKRFVVARPTPVVESSSGDLRDADAVLQTVMGAVGEAIAALTAEQRARIAGIGITSLSEEMVLLGPDSAPLGPMPTWYNQHAGREDAIEAGLDPSFSWAKLRWAHDRIARSAEPFSAVAREDVIAVTTLSAYIGDRLAYAGRFAVDHSHASRTGFFDLRDGRWLPELFEKTGWPAALLPPLVPTGTSAGMLDSALAELWGIPSSISVVLAGHDHFCGAFGLGVRGDGELYVSAGTSEAHCLIVDALPEGPIPAHVGAGRYVDGERFYLHRQLPSGHLYRHWQTLLGTAEQTQEEESSALAAEPVGSGGAVLVPGIDTDTRSWLLGLRTDANSPSVLRALFEGLACAALDIDDGLVAVSGRSITSVIAAGVPCGSPVWQEIRAHLSPAPLSVSTETEAPALGAALLAQRSVTGAPAAVQSSVAIGTSDDLRTAYRAVRDRFEQASAFVVR
ncbi:L-fuculokinase [Leifsonia sp. LS-T14]|uniref:FGGY-family carbohydrate kinase n=1 Tax=unclassified Leifsonia TaxID=2663824 RepID=UPI0035A6957C